MGRRDEAERQSGIFTKLSAIEKEVDQATDRVHRYPDRAEAHFGLATAYAKLGKYTEAVNEFKIATELSPRFVEAHNNLGVVLVELLRFEDARAAYRQAIDLDPKFVDAYTNLAWLFAEYGENLDRALELADEAVRLSQDVVTYETLAMVLNAREEYRKSDQAMQQALRLGKDNTLLEQRWETMKEKREN